MPAGSIFVSYRRGADSHAAARLAERLGARYGTERVFFDVDSIPPGEDFADLLDRRLALCSAFVPVIGPAWLDAIPRLHEADDFVRREIVAALGRADVAVLPLLVDGARMPAADGLPTDLHPLTRCNAISAPHDQFSAMVDGPLARAIDDRVQRKAAAGNMPFLWIGGALAALAIGAFIWVMIASRGG